MVKRNKYEIIALIHQDAPTLKEINPDIEKLTINLDYSKSIEYSHPSHTFDKMPNNSVVCTPECLDEFCSKGYFDLTSQIIELLQRKNNKSTGELHCDGKHKNNYSCLVILSFELIATYK